MATGRSSHDLLVRKAIAAVCTYKETSYNTLTDTGHWVGMAFDPGILDTWPQLQIVATGAEELDGTELGIDVERVDIARVPWTWQRSRPEPQDAGFLYAGLLGTPGSPTNEDTSAYAHKSTQLSVTTDGLPSLGLCLRYGGSTEPSFLLYGNTVNSVTLTCDRGQPFVGLSGQLVGSGKFVSDLVREVRTAADNGTTLTTSADIHGANSAARILSIHSIFCDLDSDGIPEKEVEWTASDAANTITITSLGGAGTTRDYVVTYRKLSTAVTPRVDTILASSRVIQPKMLTSESYMTFNPKLATGPAETLGKAYGTKIQRCEITMSRANPDPQHNIGASGANDYYANYQEVGPLSIAGSFTMRADDWMALASTLDYSNSPTLTSSTPDAKERGSFHFKWLSKSLAGAATSYYSLEVAIPKIQIMSAVPTGSGIHMHYTVSWRALHDSTLTPEVLVVDKQSYGYLYTAG